MRKISIAIGLTVATLAARSHAHQTPASGASALTAIIAEFRAESPAALTPQHFVDELEHTEEMLARVRALDPTALSRDEAIDRRLIQALLAGRMVEEQRIRRWRLDPLVYMSSTRTLLAILNDAMVFEDPGSHAQAVLAALRAIPADLKNGQANLTLYVERFRDRGVAVTTAAMTLFESDLPALIEMLPAENPDLIAASAYTRQSMFEWSDFLTTNLPKRPPGYYPIGIPAYDALLQSQHLAAYDSNELYRFTRTAFDETLDELDAAANGIDPDQSWLEILSAAATEEKTDAPAGTPPPPVTPRTAIDAAQTRFAAMDLPPLPWKQRIDVVKRPPSLLDMVYYPTWGGLATDADATSVSRWWISPADPPAGEFLGPDDGSVFSISAYAAVADHILRLYQLHNASALRRAVASSMTVEGWAMYNEQLAADTGAFPRDRAHLRQLQIKLWRIARVIVDVGLHTGRLTEPQAKTLLTEQVGLPAGAAALEIADAATAPAAHLGYMGFVELRRIRADLERERDARFSLMDFHKRVLEAGPLPPALIRALLIGT